MPAAITVKRAKYEFRSSDRTIQRHKDDQDWGDWWERETAHCKIQPPILASLRLKDGTEIARREVLAGSVSLLELAQESDKWCRLWYFTRTDEVVDGAVVFRQDVTFAEANRPARWKK